MALSVSSKKVFSGSAITLTRHQNRLKGYIVEALQVVKCIIRTNLLVCPEMLSSGWEENLKDIMDKEEYLCIGISWVMDKHYEDDVVLEENLNSNAEEEEEGENDIFCNI